MEMEVIMGFRVWQLMFLALAGLITVVVLLCCFMKCRVPRTKQEIEADFKRKEITRRFRFLLDRVQIEDTSLRTAIEKVNELYTNREKMKRKKKKKADEEEDIISQGSSYLFQDEKLTIKDRIKKLLGLEKEDGLESDDDTFKEKSEKSEAQTKKHSDSEEDEDATTVPEVKVNLKHRQQSDESQDTSGSHKLEDLHSKLSLLQDSPPHDSSSRLSLLQDSPPHSGVTLLEDSPPHYPKVSSECSNTSSWTVQKTESQDLGKSSSSKQKTDSQDSNDSSKNQDSRTFSRNQKSKSHLSKIKKNESDSLDSDNYEHLKKQKSDSSESRDSETQVKVLKKFEPKESKGDRRESITDTSSVEIAQRWMKASQKPKSNNSAKSPKSLDNNPR